MRFIVVPPDTRSQFTRQCEFKQHLGDWPLPCGIAMGRNHSAIYNPSTAQFPPLNKFGNGWPPFDKLRNRGQGRSAVCNCIGRHYSIYHRVRRAIPLQSLILSISLAAWAMRKMRFGTAGNDIGTPLRR